MTPHSIQPLTLKRTTMMTMMVTVMLVITLMLTMLIVLMVRSLRMRMVMMAGRMCPSLFPIRGELAVVAICCFSQNHCNFYCTAIAFATTTTTSTTGWVVPGSGIRVSLSFLSTHEAQIANENALSSPLLGRRRNRALRRPHRRRRRGRGGAKSPFRADNSGSNARTTSGK